MSRVQLAWVALLVGGFGTYLIRVSFLAMAHRVTEIPERWRMPLRLIPPAVLAALITPAVLRPDGVLTPLGPRPLAALIALGIALWTRSVIATILVGLATVIGLEVLLG